jgi:nucleotide-binding universal stress UspA family protein
MYDRILVPTDGSPTAGAAMQAAVEMAARDGADIHVLNVINTRYYDTSIDSAVKPLRERGERYVDSLADKATDAGVPVTTTVELGRPARTILDYVDDHDVDLVVMGTSGRGDLERRLLGSTTEHVVTHADVPVHVVPAV